MAQSITAEVHNRVKALAQEKNVVLASLCRCCMDSDPILNDANIFCPLKTTQMN